MPELPEVETVMRGLMPVLVGETITYVNKRRKDLRIPFPSKMKQRLEGRTVETMHRRAKYILISLDDGQVLVIHLGMSGRVSIVMPEQDYTLQKHDHFILETSGGTRIIYNDPRRFGMIFMVAQNDLAQHPAFKSLGPEPLGNEFSGPVLVQRLKGKTTSIKQALLDQRVVAGVGNIYACEALYQSGIHPARPAGKVSGKKAEDLARAVKDVLTRAIKAGGSTLKDYRHADEELGYFQHSFSVYDREGEACATCDCNIVPSGGVKRIIQSGRSSFYCSKRQK